MCVLRVETLGKSQYTNHSAILRCKARFRITCLLRSGISRQTQFLIPNGQKCLCTRHVLYSCSLSFKYFLDRIEDSGRATRVDSKNAQTCCLTLPNHEDILRIDRPPWGIRGVPCIGLISCLKRLKKALRG